MKEDKIKTREKIILATMECIEIHGLHNVTMRHIAKKADVNLASINYHFGCKKNLLEMALKRALDEAFLETNEALQSNNVDPVVAIKVFLENALAGSMETPGLTKAHLFNVLESREPHNFSFQYLEAFFVLLQNSFAAENQTLEGRNRTYTILQVISAAFMVGLMSHLFELATKLDFHDREIQKEYLDNIFKHYFEDKSKL